jgi:la-related protein 1
LAKIKIFIFCFSLFFAGQLYGLEKFWAFRKYYKNSNKLDVDPKLEGYLEKFKSIEDFRVLEPQINEMLEGIGKLPSSATKRRHRSVSDSEGGVAVVAGPSTSRKLSTAGSRNSINENTNTSRKR